MADVNISFIITKSEFVFLINNKIHDENFIIKRLNEMYFHESEDSQDDIVESLTEKKFVVKKDNKILLSPVIDFMINSIVNASDLEVNADDRKTIVSCREGYSILISDYPTSLNTLKITPLKSKLPEEIDI